MLCVDEAQRNAFSWVSALFSPGAMLVVLLLQRWPSSRTAFLPLERCVPFLVLGRGSSRGAGQPVSKHSNAADVAAGRRPSASVLNVAPLAEPERPRPAAEGPVCMEFEGVAFAYGENLPFVLQDVDVALEPGTVTASWEIRAAARRRSPA